MAPGPRSPTGSSAADHRSGAPNNIVPQLSRLSDAWTTLARRARLSHVAVQWNVSAEFPPHLARTVPTPTGPASVAWVPTGWRVRYPDGATYGVDRADGMVAVSISGHDHESIPHFTRLAGPITALIMAVCDHYPLHACGLIVEGRMIALHAPSGGGKSTLAALAARQGVEIAGDDLLAATSEGVITALPGSLRITPELAPESMRPVLTLPDGRGWYPLDPGTDMPLGALVLLERGAGVALTPLRGVERLKAVLRAGFLSHLDPDPPKEFHELVWRVSGQTKAWRLTLPGGLTEVDAAWPAIQRALAQAT